MQRGVRLRGRIVRAGVRRRRRGVLLGVPRRLRRARAARRRAALQRLRMRRQPH